MSARLELQRRRDVTALFRDSLALYWSHLGTFLALSAAIVVPVELVVQGIGLEQLSSSYDTDLTVAQTAVTGLVTFLLITPLVTAMCIYALRQLAEGGRPAPGPAIVAGFEAFTPLFFAVLMAAAGIAAGLLLFVAPGIYLFVRWYFVPMTVVLEEVRGVEALKRSAAATQGFWWRTLGIVLLAQIAIILPTLLLAAPFAGIAESSDRAVWALVGTIVTEIVTAPFVAIYATLLWFDLRARSAAA